MIQSSISLSLEVQPRIKNELTFRNRRHHRLVRKRGSKLTVKPRTKRQISLHRGTTWVTSVLPNAKLTLSPVGQVYTWMGPARDFPPKFERYNTWLTGEGVNLPFGDTEVTHVVPGRAKFGASSQAWPLVLTLFSLQACDGGDFEKLVRF